MSPPLKIRLAVRVVFALAVFSKLVTFGIPLALAQGGSAALESLVKRAPASAIGISVLDLTTDKWVFRYNSEQPLKPASLLKVVTATAALSELGGEYRYRTEVLGAPLIGHHAPRLVIKGGGATDLTIETAWILARRIKLLGIKEIGKLEFDRSLFQVARERVGQRAYESGSSPLSFNFNSIAISVCPARPGEAAVVLPDPWESGVRITGAVKTAGKAGGSDITVDEVPNQSGEIVYRVAGQIGSKEKCRTIYRSVADPVRYFGQVLARILEMLGVKVERLSFSEPTDRGELEVFFTQESKPLSLVVRDLNHYSNNFVAEQILYALGGLSGQPWSRESGLKRIQVFLSQNQISTQSMELSDGSGLSHDNRISADAIVKVLRLAARSPAISAEFESSLSTGEKSGTLKDRVFSPPGEHAVVHAKTGSLTGVSSLGGFIYTKGGHRLAFAIILNNTTSKDKAIAFEDQLVGKLYEIF